MLHLFGTSRRSLHKDSRVSGGCGPRVPVLQPPPCPKPQAEAQGSRRPQAVSVWHSSCSSPATCVWISKAGTSKHQPTGGSAEDALPGPPVTTTRSRAGTCSSSTSCTRGGAEMAHRSLVAQRGTASCPQAAGLVMGKSPQHVTPAPGDVGVRHQ